jgi:hypothetical protein
MQTFEQKIKKYGLSPNQYIIIAKKNAKDYGYDPKLLKFSDKIKYKLNYDGIYFGDSNYFDYILYSLLAKKKIITQEHADKRQKLYLDRALKIKGDWRDNMLSKNNLAIHILW